MVDVANTAGIARRATAERIRSDGVPAATSAASDKNCARIARAELRAELRAAELRGAHRSSVR